MSYKYFIVGLACAVLCQFGNAQTTLSGDHIITGDLDVGTTGTPGNLEVSGETGNSAAPSISVTGDGGVLFGGTFGTGQIPATGDGIRMMWYPKKAAFLAGYDWDLGWDDVNIGNYSVAIGNASRAGGVGAAAFNSGNAIGESSTALGSGVASGWRSLAIGGGYAIATQSVAGGFASASAGGNSIAFGEEVYAAGHSSTALGIYNSAIGDGSVALGVLTDAYGDNSVSMGDRTTANAFATLVIGRCNVGGGSAASWVASDPLFEIGNGTGNTSDPIEVQKRNAMTVYKNGKVQMTGDVELTKRQGDILMGEFGNPE